METEKKKDKWVYLAERIIKSPGRRRRYSLEELKAEFKAYVDYYRDNTTTYMQKSRQKKGGTGSEVQAERVERKSPMTEISFCVWLGYDEKWLPNTILDLEDKEHPSEEDKKYLEFLHEVRAFLRSHLLDGAIVAEYNYNVIAALLGLKKNVDVTTDNKALGAPVINLVPDTMTREQYQSNPNEVAAVEITDEE